MASVREGFLGTTKHGQIEGFLETISYCLSFECLSKEVGRGLRLEGHIGLPDLQPVSYSSRSCMGRGGHVCLGIYACISIPGLQGIVLHGAIHLSHRPAAHQWSLNL